MPDKKEQKDEKAAATAGRLVVSGRKIERYKTALLVAVQITLMVIVFFQVNYLSYRKHQQRRRHRTAECSKVDKYTAPPEQHAQQRGASQGFLARDQPRQFLLF